MKKCIISGIAAAAPHTSLLRAQNAFGKSDFPRLESRVMIGVDRCLFIATLISALLWEATLRSRDSCPYSMWGIV